MEIVLRNACNAFRLLRENVQLRKKFFRFTYCITLPALISKYVRCISNYVGHTLKYKAHVFDGVQHGCKSVGCQLTVFVCISAVMVVRLGRESRACPAGAYRATLAVGDSAGTFKRELYAARAGSFVPFMKKIRLSRCCECINR